MKGLFIFALLVLPAVLLTVDGGKLRDILGEWLRVTFTSTWHFITPLDVLFFLRFSVDGLRLGR